MESKLHSISGFSHELIHQKYLKLNKIHKSTSRSVTHHINHMLVSVVVLKLSMTKQKLKNYGVQF